MDFLDIAEYELKFQRHLLRQFDKLRKIKDDGQLFCKKNKKGYRAYYIKDKTGGEETLHQKIRKGVSSCLQASGKRPGHFCS